MGELIVIVDGDLGRWEEASLRLRRTIDRQDRIRDARMAIAPYEHALLTELAHHLPVLDVIADTQEPPE